MTVYIQHQALVYFFLRRLKTGEDLLETSQVLDPAESNIAAQASLAYSYTDAV